MEQSESEKTASTQADAEAHTDAIDHERLARLVAARREPVARIALGALRKKSYALLIALGIIAIVLALGGVYYMMQRQTASPLTEPNENIYQPTPGQPQTPTGTPIEHEMVAIPGGRFQMGRDNGNTQEGPVHSVAVRAFLIDNTEVTNAEYADFVRETGYLPPSHWSYGKPNLGEEIKMLPVVNVSYRDAVKFAEWRSERDHVKYRLPTEEEWEYAAKGGDQNNTYPWGNTWVKGHAGLKDSGATSVKAVGSYPEDKTRWGVLDMAGNVYEWTSSKASLYPGNEAQINPDHRNWMIVRGGSYLTDYKQRPPTTYRDWFDPARKEPVIGFRLVRVGPSGEGSSALPSVNRLLTNTY
jgi:formylglycine-generating enzyme required for sulfatase activity